MKHRIAGPATSCGDLEAQPSAAGGSYAQAYLRVLMRIAAGALVVMACLTSIAHSSPTGEATEDIIGGCNQFIKFARKGRSRQDPDSMRQQGECFGAVRTMLATEIASNNICPTENTKLV